MVLRGAGRMMVWITSVTKPTAGIACNELNHKEHTHDREHKWVGEPHPGLVASR